MHRLTIFKNLDTQSVESVANIIHNVGYVIQRGVDNQDHFQFYFDGVKDSQQNDNIFQNCRNLLYPKKIDFILQEPYLPIRLMCFDMDGTSLKIETMDEFADYYLGGDVKNKMAQATYSVINLGTDYKLGFINKIKCLKGLQRNLMNEFYNQHIKNLQISDGLTDFIAFTNQNKIKTAILSGGFTEFAKELAYDLGFCYFHASNCNFTKNHNNEYIFNGDIEESQIFTEENKKQKLVEYRNYFNLDPHNVCAIGDGSNDIAMLKEAGLGIAYHAKDIVKKNIKNWLEFNNFSVLKYIMI